MSKNLSERFHEALNRLVKWKMVFVGWQLGTRAKGDPECDAVRDHREVTILLRAEVTALTKILIDQGIMTIEEYQKGMIEEAELLSKDYEKRFPGCKATDIGIDMDVSKVKEYMKDWRP